MWGDLVICLHPAWPTIQQKHGLMIWRICSVRAFFCLQASSFPCCVDPPTTAPPPATNQDNPLVSLLPRALTLTSLCCSMFNEYGCCVPAGKPTFQHVLGQL